jgi:glycosyltransferase involved in cell wall biosynthesis
LKILFVIPSITNYFTFLEDLVNALIDANEEVHLATSTQHISDISCYQRDLRCTLHDINFPRGFALLSHLKAASLLNQLVTDIKPDLINVHFSAAIFTAALAKKKSWPYTMGTFHGLSYPIIKGWQKMVIGIAEKWSAQQMDLVYVLTEDDRENLERSAGKNKVRAFRSFGLGCDLSTFNKVAVPAEKSKKLRNELGIEPNDFVFIFIGRQVHFKGFDKIIKAFLKLYDVHSNFKLILVGAKDNIHSNNLTPAEELTMKNCPGIIPVGWRENVSDYLSISDVNVFPSIREGLPVNLMESLAMGVPVITINSRGCRDVIIHQIDGLVLEKNTVSDLADAMLLLYQNPDLLKRLSNNCQRARFRFDRQNFIDEQFEIFKEVTSAH